MATQTFNADSPEVSYSGNLVKDGSKLKLTTQNWLPEVHAVGEQLLFYNPSDTSTIEETGNRVDRILDISGNGFHGTQSGINRPLTNINALNGHNMLTFDAATQNYLNFSNLGATTGSTLMMVMYIKNDPPVSPNYGLHYVSGQAVGTSTGFPAPNNVFTDTFGAETNYSFNLRDITTPVIYICEVGTDHVKVWEDGTLIQNLTSTIVPSFGTNDHFLGMRSKQDAWLDGYIAEYIILPFYGREDTRARYEGSLAWKFGLEANLDPASPYASAPPQAAEYVEGEIIVAGDAGSGRAYDHSTITESKTESNFIASIKTDNEGAGSSDTEYLLKLDPAADYINAQVSDGNGKIIPIPNGVPSMLLSYDVAGEYILKIVGDQIPMLNFGSYVDNSYKLIDIKQWGTNKWQDVTAMFYQCGKMDISATDAPDLSLTDDLDSMFNRCYEMNPDLDHWDVGHVTNMYSMFQFCQLFNKSLNSWDVSNVTDFGVMFEWANIYNQSLSNWDTSAATRMRYMFGNAGFRQSVETFDIRSLTDAFAFMAGTSYMDTPDYDATLISFSAQADTFGVDNVQISFGVSVHTLGGAAEAAKDNLVNVHSWTITDGN